MYKYNLSLEAKADILRIFEFELSRFGLQRVIIYYDLFFECFAKIASNPFMFLVVKNSKK